MVRDAKGYFDFIATIERKVKELEATALSPSSSYEITQAARYRRLQLKEIIELATGEISSLS